MSRYFDVRTEGAVTVVHFTEPHLNEGNVQQIGEELVQLAERLGQGELHLDFSDVQYLSTAVVAKLLSLHKRVTREGGRFVLTHLHDLYEVFSVTRLDKVMDVRRDETGTTPPPA